MVYASFGHRMPQSLSKYLFGCRTQCGKLPPQNDPVWNKWVELYPIFYEETQKKSIGGYLNHCGYRVMSDVDLSEKVILEVGPGTVEHIKYWKTKPRKYILVDKRIEFLIESKRRLESAGVDVECCLVGSQSHEDLINGRRRVDVIVSFYSLEHIYPLAPYLDDVMRTLDDGGIFVGAIPGEGGLLWGVGRLMTTRRLVKNKYNLDYDKIVCWEHPNWAETVLNELEGRLMPIKVHFYPFNIPLIDINAIISFVYRKRG